MEPDANHVADTIVGTSAAPRASIRAPDRYELLERLGEGGMGVVWAARDHVLERVVAFKVMHDRFLGAPDQERLAAEARAMARLSHRNVVAVYDVGERDGRTYLTMELVRGRHLGAWLASPRSWREVVAVFIAAGTGLAAAHAVGIVHRDVKPSNILISDDGGVYVADFGVAHASPSRAFADGTQLVATTAGFIGTPTYMAPERLRGDVADARGDQFAFCVALYEALHGRRPFTGETIGDLRAAIERGCPPPVRDVPRWLHAAVERGLAVDPAARFPSLDALLVALTPRRRRAWWIAAAGVGLATGTIALASRGSQTVPPIERADVAAERALTALDGCAYSPAFADGGTVVFDHTLGDAVDLFKVSLDGGAPVRLTSDPAWEWRASPGRYPGEVVHLTTPLDPAATSSVRFLDVTTGSVTDELDIAANSVAFADGALHYVDASSEYVRRRAGAADEIIARLPFVVSQIAVAPGGRVAIVGQAPGERPRICLTRPGDTEPRCLADRVRESRPALAADVLYFAGVGGIHRRDLATGDDRLLVPRAQAGGGLAISPDRRTLVWSTCWQKGPLVELAGAPPRVIREGVVTRGVVTGAGGRIAWIVDPDSTIELREPNGAIVQLVDGWDEIVSLSFDRAGDRIAFAARGTGHGVYVTAGHGLTSATMVSDGETDMNPFWLADGRIAFTRLDDRHRIAHVYLATPEGGPVEHVLSSRTTLGVRWSTNELLVGSSSKLYWWDPATRSERGPMFDDRGSIFSAALSPDGRWLAVQVGATNAGNEIWRVRLEPAGEPELMLRLGSDQSISGGVAIDDTGSVLAAVLAWRGDLRAVPLTIY